MYIILVSMQYSVLAPRPIQFLETGAHCSRLAKKNPMIQLLVTATMVHMKPLKIGPERSLPERERNINPVGRRCRRCCSPSVEEKDAQFRESKSQCLSQLGSEDILLTSRQPKIFVRLWAAANLQQDPCTARDYRITTNTDLGMST